MPVTPSCPSPPATPTPALPGGGNSSTPRPTGSASACSWNRRSLRFSVRRCQRTPPVLPHHLQAPSAWHSCTFPPHLRSSPGGAAHHGQCNDTTQTKQASGPYIPQFKINGRSEARNLPSYIYRLGDLRSVYGSMTTVGIHAPIHLQVCTPI
ncbi:hypothetical protein PVAP13_6KG109912 [Panicum virgatum]|uniref:Uncharacterized protein n=1 Tax=Panicum virgatum TaxID=38727 RepID=A0A8T0R9M7_PANVG|nr:hypothetical protein PVAP13_6KG109912 [Panicum virgatum]